MGIESANTSPSRKETLSLPDARRVIWGAGNIALEKTVESDEQRSATANAVGGLLDHLDRVQAAADIIAPALLTGETPHISINELTSGIRAEAKAIEADEACLHDGELNPFTITDPNYAALQSLRLYIDAARNQVRGE